MHVKQLLIIKLSICFLFIYFSFFERYHIVLNQKRMVHVRVIKNIGNQKFCTFESVSCIINEASLKSYLVISLKSF